VTRPDEAGQSRSLTFSPQQFPSIDHGFAVSIHRSQGCTVDKAMSCPAEQWTKTWLTLRLHATGRKPNSTLHRTLRPSNCGQSQNYLPRVILGQGLLFGADSNADMNSGLNW